jgi:hypothetical protein
LTFILHAMQPAAIKGCNLCCSDYGEQIGIIMNSGKLS